MMYPEPVVTVPGGGATVVGVLGDPVAHSLSPTMHNSGFRALDMDWVYVPFHVAEQQLSEAIAGVKALRLGGVNVTIPHKEAVMAFMDELTPAARAAGAVNTVIHTNNRLIGDNTDGIGFVRSLREEVGFDPKGARVFVYGAGGAAKAIAVALAEAGAEHIAIANRTVVRAQGLATETARFGAETSAYGLEDDGLRDVIQHSELFVQTTPAGMAGTDSGSDLPWPLQQSWLHPNLVVADIVYTPLETPLVRAAQAAGCVVALGWGMLLYQGAEAFTRWTGEAAPVGAMRTALLKALEADVVTKD